MRIAHIKVRNFRSLQAVELTSLGRFNVFYGENGAGKSALLDAIDVGLKAACRLAGSTPHGSESTTDLIRPSDFRHGESHLTIDMAIQLSESDLLADLERTGPAELLVSVRAERLGKDRSVSRLQTLSLNSQQGEDQPLDLLQYTGSRKERELPSDWTERGPKIRDWLTDRVLRRTYRKVGALRSVRSAPKSGGGEAFDDRDLVQSLLAERAFAQALHTAQSSPDVELRDALEALRKLLKEGAGRPPFDPVYDVKSGRYDVQEVVETEDGRRHGVSLSQRSLGAEQIYTILGGIVLGGTSAAAIEEPEAHLHAPTSGKLLRDLLERLVKEDYVEQLFVATHSNLFDLDPDGWFEVTQDRDATRIKRHADWSELYAQHLYEPGPARSALRYQLEILGKSRTVFQHDGSPISAGEMIKMLDRDDQAAMAFLQDVHRAAVNAVRLRATSPDESSEP